MAAIPASTASIFSTLMRRRGRGATLSTPAAPRFLFKRQPDGVFDREALRGGKPLGEGFCFLRQINHREKSNTNRRKRLETRGLRLRRFE
jgi:hypothetical protein